MATRIGISLAMGLLSFLGFHLLRWRLQPSSQPRIVRLTLLGLFGTGVAEGVHFAWVGWQPLASVAILWYSIFGVVTYLFFYAGIVRSVSLTVLAKLLRSPSPSLSFEALLEAYDRSTGFEGRLDALEAAGWIRRSGDQILLTGTGARIAQATGRLARLLGGELEG